MKIKGKINSVTDKQSGRYYRVTVRCHFKDLGDGNIEFEYGSKEILDAFKAHEGKKFVIVARD